MPALRHYYSEMRGRLQLAEASHGSGGDHGCFKLRIQFVDVAVCRELTGDKVIESVRGLHIANRTQEWIGPILVGNDSRSGLIKFTQQR